SSPNVYWFVTRTAIGGNEPAPVESGRRGRRAPAESADATVPTTAVDMHPLGAYLDSVIELVAEPFARATDVSPADAAAWASGAGGFVRGSGEWWLGHRHVEASPLTRERLTERVTLSLWTGPAAVLHHNKPRAASLSAPLPDTTCPGENDHGGEPTTTASGPVTTPTATGSGARTPAAPRTAAGPRVDVRALQQMLRGRWPEAGAEARRLVAEHPELWKREGLTKEEHREITLQQ